MKAVALLLVLAFSLAGCSDEPTGETDAGQEQEPTGSEAPETNSTLNLTAPLARLNVTAENGTAPLLVTFNLDGEGNFTHWAFDFGNGTVTNGTELPTALNASYPAGLWNVRYTLTGPGGSTNATASINVTDAAPEITVLEPFSATVDLDLPCPGCGDGGTITCAWRAHANDAAQDCAWIDFPDELAGQPFTLTGNGLDPDLLFWETCNSGVGPKFMGDGPEAGIVPAGMGCVLVWEQLDFLISVTFAITPE